VGLTGQGRQQRQAVGTSEHHKDEHVIKAEIDQIRKQTGSQTGGEKRGSKPGLGKQPRKNKFQPSYALSAQKSISQRRKFFWLWMSSTWTLVRPLTLFPTASSWRN